MIYYGLLLDRISEVFPVDGSINRGIFQFSGDGVEELKDAGKEETKKIDHGKTEERRKEGTKNGIYCFKKATTEEKVSFPRALCKYLSCLKLVWKNHELMLLNNT